MRMLVLLLESSELASDAEPFPLAPNIPLPVISFILYPEHGLLRVANGSTCLTKNYFKKVN